MIDRQKLETVLSRRFPRATRDQIAAAANAIMELEDEWEELNGEHGFRFDALVRCPDTCALAHAGARTQFGLLRRRTEGSTR